MKKEPLQKLILLLAAMDLPPQELRYLLEELRSIPPQALFSRISEVQFGLLGSSSPWADQEQSAKNIRSTISNDSTVAERAARLLQVEAGLPTALAVSHLADMLVTSGILAREGVPPLSKKSLHEWIRRLQTRVDSKEILRCATLIRNEFVHAKPSDWVLRDARK